MAQDELQSIVQRMIDAGEPEDNIALVIREYQPTERPRRSAIEMLGEAEAVNTNPEFMQGQAKAGGKFAEVALPILGGMAGGIPGAALGASAGGAIGRASSSQPITARNMATDAALGAAGQAAGPLIGKGIQKAGRLLGRTAVRGAVRPSAALKREFGGSGAIADTILDERLPTAAVAGRRTTDARNAVMGRLQQAAPTASPVRPAELLDDLKPVISRAGERARLGLPDESDDIVGRLIRIGQRNPDGIDLMDAQSLKEEAQDIASKVYSARALGHNVNNLTAETDEAVASGLRRAIETRVPDVGPMNARTQRLMGASKALQQAQDRPNALTNMMSLLTGSQNLAGGVAMRGLGSSRLGSAGGVAINEAGKALGNPQAAKAALLATLLGPDGNGGE